MRIHRTLTLVALGIVLAATWAGSALSDAPLSPGILRRYDFAPGLDGWSALSGAPTIVEAGGQSLLRLESARVRSSDLPAENALRYVVTFRMQSATGTADIIDLRDAAGTQLVRLYAHAGKVWLEGSGLRQGFVMPPGTSWHRGEIEISGTTAVGWYHTMAISVPMRPGGPVAWMESGASSGALHIDMARVDRTPRIDDGLMLRSTYEALEHFDSHRDSDMQWVESGEGFRDPRSILFSPQQLFEPGEIEFIAAPAPPGPFLVETAFDIRNALFRPDGTSIVAALPGAAGATAPIWWVSLDLPIGTALEGSTLTFNGADGSRQAIADVEFTGGWRALVAHSDPVTGRLRLTFDDALVFDDDVPGLSMVERVAMGDITDGLVPVVQRTGAPFDISFDGGIPMALLDPAGAP